jgi:hypothetical protein
MQPVVEDVQRQARATLRARADELGRRAAEAASPATRPLRAVIASAVARFERLIHQVDRAARARQVAEQRKAAVQALRKGRQENR